MAERTCAQLTPEVGDRVLLKGTGRWWSGSTFVAVIADVDQPSDTVKVRYSDGGYKRLSRKDFLQICISLAADHHEEEQKERAQAEAQAEDALTATASSSRLQRTLIRRLSQAQAEIASDTAPNDATTAATLKYALDST